MLPGCERGMNVVCGCPFGRSVVLTACATMTGVIALAAGPLPGQALSKIARALKANPLLAAPYTAIAAKVPALRCASAG